MLEHFFVRSHVIARLRCGLLGPYLDDWATSLHCQGYAPSSIQSYLRTGDTFGRWLHRHGYTVSALDTAIVQRYVTGLMRYRSGHLPKAAEGLNHLLRFLQHQGVVCFATNVRFLPKVREAIRMATWTRSMRRFLLNNGAASPSHPCAGK